MKGLFDDFLQTPNQGSPHVEALSKLLQNRPSPRDTNSTPGRSAILILLNTMAHELKEPDFKWMGDLMAAAWAGEGGWDRQTLVDALGRDRQQMPTVQGPEAKLP